MNIEDKVKGVAGKGTSFLKEFRDFAMKGNVIDMAVGVVIGTAFGKIVSSLVSDIIMPLVGVLVGSVDFKDLGITLQEKTADHDAIVLGYGAFIQTKSPTNCDAHLAESLFQTRSRVSDE